MHKLRNGLAFFFSALALCRFNVVARPLRPHLFVVTAIVHKPVLTHQTRTSYCWLRMSFVMPFSQNNLHFLPPMQGNGYGPPLLSPPLCSLYIKKEPVVTWVCGYVKHDGKPGRVLVPSYCQISWPRLLLVNASPVFFFIFGVFAFGKHFHRSNHYHLRCYVDCRISIYKLSTSRHGWY